MKVILVMAQTLDGKIAKSADHFPDWTGKADKKLFVQLTKAAGVFVMGRTTYDTIGKPLPGRLNVVMTRNKERVQTHENLWVTTQTPRQIYDELHKEGYDQMVLAGGAQVNTAWLQAGLIDEMVITVSPLVFGEGIGVFTPGTQVNMELLSVEPLDRRVVKLHYRVEK